MTPQPPGGLNKIIIWKKLKIILKMCIKRLGMRLEAELKVPPGGFRGGFLAKLESSDKESGGSAAVRINN